MLFHTYELYLLDKNSQNHSRFIDHSAYSSGDFHGLPGSSDTTGHVKIASAGLTLEPTFLLLVWLQLSEIIVHLVHYLNRSRCFQLQMHSRQRPDCLNITKLLQKCSLYLIVETV